MAINAYDRRSFAQYTPLTMQEVLMPAQLQRERHDALDVQYAAINDEMAKMKFLVDNESDNSGFKQGFYNYQRQLQGATEDLLTNGINHTSMRKMLGIKNAYTEMSAPIAKAYETKSMDDKLRAEYSAKGIVVDKRKRDLWDYAQNGYVPIGVEHVDQNAVTKDLADVLSSLQKSQRSPEYKEEFMVLLRDLGYDVDGSIGMMLETNVISGLTPDELENNPLVQRLKYEVLKKHNAINDDGSYKSWMSDADKNILDSSAYIGSFGAVNGNKRDIINNPGFEWALKNSPLAQQESHNRSGSGNGNGSLDDGVDKSIMNPPVPSTTDITVSGLSSEQIDYKDGNIVVKNYIYDKQDLDSLNALYAVMNKDGLNTEQYNQLRAIAERNNNTGITELIDSLQNDEGIWQISSSSGGDMPFDGSKQILKKLRSRIKDLIASSVVDEGIIKNINAVASAFNMTNEEYLNEIKDLKRGSFKSTDYAFIDDAVKMEAYVQNYIGINNTNKLPDIDKTRGGTIGKATGTIDKIYGKDLKRNAQYKITNNGLVVVAGNGKEYLVPDKMSLAMRQITQATLTPEVMNHQNILTNFTITKTDDSVSVTHNGNNVSLTPAEYVVLTEAKGSPEQIEYVSKKLLSGLGINLYEHTNLGETFNGVEYASDFSPFEVVMPFGDKKRLKFVGVLTPNGGSNIGVISNSSEVSGSDRYKSAVYVTNIQKKLFANGLSVALSNRYKF